MLCAVGWSLLILTCMCWVGILLCNPPDTLIIWLTRNMSAGVVWKSGTHSLENTGRLQLSFPFKMFLCSTCVFYLSHLFLLGGREGEGESNNLQSLLNPIYFFSSPFESLISPLNADTAVWSNYKIDCSQFCHLLMISSGCLPTCL